MKRFEADIQRIFTHLSALQSGDRRVFEAIGRQESPGAVLEQFIAEAGLKPEGSMPLAAAKRLFMLREEGVLSLLRAQGHQPGAIEAQRDRMRHAVARFYEARFKALLEWIEQEALLSPFYRRVLAGMYHTGLGFNRLHSRWLAAITQSHAYLEQQAGTPQAVGAYLQEKGLIDRDSSGKAAERCYTVLGSGGAVLAYAEAFEPEIEAIAAPLEALVSDLAALEDPDYGEKEAWLAYLRTLIAALRECDRQALFGRWVAVDEAWMAITGPIQPGHPMEYYEDRYRCAVAPEWDVRLHNPAGAIGACKATIWPMAEATFLEADVPEGAEAMRQAKNSLDRTRLYGARPLLFFGALLDGLFSAQVVPNDEAVSARHGKKIFAFGEHVLASMRMRPAMALEREIFEPDFLSRYRSILFGPDQRWLEIYDIETVGHELGHLLWVDTTTESAMNQSGAFKLIEEFKATAGALMGFFKSERAEQRDLLEAVVMTHTKRSVELIAWRESPEVAAYYHEALIHLSGLFTSGVCRFESERLLVRLEKAPIEALMAWYESVWLQLAQTYLKKCDARSFLERFVRGDLPTDEPTRRFVAHYSDRYQAIGQVVDQKGSNEG